MTVSAELERIAADDDLLEVARLAVTKELVLRRDDLQSESRGAGLVICEEDGIRSELIRMSIEAATAIAMRAIASHLRVREQVAEARSK